MDGGEIHDKDKNKIMVCKDTRDNETFKYNTNSITNIRQDLFGVSSVDIVTLDGKEKRLSRDMTWLKCEKE